MLWYVHRRGDGSIASAHQEVQPGYAEETLDDASSAELQAFRAPPVPSSVTATQLIRALNQMGLLDAVNAAAVTAGGLTLELWKRAPVFARDDPMVSGIAQAIGKTQADLDGLFRLASTF